MVEKKEFNFKGFRANGFLFLFLMLAIPVGIVWLFAQGPWIAAVAGVVCSVCWLIMLAGFVKLEPNEASVMVFFGKYKGTFHETGFYWVNPFITRKKLSMRVRNLNVDPIKVNDKVGNPVLIGLVLVWRLKDTYRAMFEIDSQTMAKKSRGESISSVVGKMEAFENFVAVQSDAALRQVAGQYAYDNNVASDDELTLRSGGEKINEDLLAELNSRLQMAGIEIVEARINYLAYAPEIAAVMLRRQQAEAIISAREKIVEGAVTMVKMALDRIEDEDIIKMDADRKAAMVSNLLVVLCADESAQPVINAGSIS